MTNENTDLSNEQQVRDFFDDLAPTYQQRYSESDLVLKRIYAERISLALNVVEKQVPKILDIGCGTGSLYDTLKLQYADFDYLACDISSQMLMHSTIPAAQRQLGKVYELEWSNGKFDLVTMLGLTTYFSHEELIKHLNFIQSRLSPKGKIAVTFTNKTAIGVLLRNLLKPILRPFISKNRVQAQPFTINCYTPDSAIKLLPNNYKVESVSYFNYLIPGLKFISSPLAKKAAIWMYDRKFWSKRIAGDFIIILSLK